MIVNLEKYLGFYFNLTVDFEFETDECGATIDRIWIDSATADTVEKQFKNINIFDGVDMKNPEVIKLIDNMLAHAMEDLVGDAAWKANN